MFEPRLALASLSGTSDAAWAQDGLPHVGCAFLGGIALDDPTRQAAEDMVTRDREEFLPADPFVFVDRQLERLEDGPLRPAFNVRSASIDPIARVGRLCAERDAILEVNAHCRQAEMCAAGSGETLLHQPDRLGAQVTAAADTGAPVSVKVRAELPGVDLPAIARRIRVAGADAIHVDAMDDEPVIAHIAKATPELFVIANNGVRDEATAREYLAYGADAVSVGRASDRPAVLAQVRRTVDEWFAETRSPVDQEVRS